MKDKLYCVSDKEFEKIVKESKNYLEIMTKLGYKSGSYSSMVLERIKNRIYLQGLNFQSKNEYKKQSAIYKIEQKIFIQSVETNGTYADILRDLKLEYSNFNFFHLKNRIKELNLKLAPRKTKKNKYNNKEDIFKKDSPAHRGLVKRRIIEENLLSYECSECGLGQKWNNKTLVLCLDHINGINNDNRLENLRFLCPNCHSQTETFAGKNKIRII